MLVIESVNRFTVSVTEMTGLLPSKVKHHNLCGELTEFASILVLCSHHDFKEVMARITSDFRFPAYLEKLLGEFSRPSITFLLRIQRHPGLQTDEKITGFIRNIGFDEFNG